MWCPRGRVDLSTMTVHLEKMTREESIRFFQRLAKPPIPVHFEEKKDGSYSSSGPHHIEQSGGFINTRRRSTESTESLHGSIRFFLTVFAKSPVSMIHLFFVVTHLCLWLYWMFMSTTRIHYWQNYSLLFVLVNFCQGRSWWWWKHGYMFIMVLIIVDVTRCLIVLEGQCSDLLVYISMVLYIIAPTLDLHFCTPFVYRGQTPHVPLCGSRRQSPRDPCNGSRHALQAD